MDHRYLTVYFSAGGNTERVAQIIAKTIDSKLHRICPREEYTREDLNWRNKESRTTVEMSDKSFRPEVINEVVDLEAVETVFLGFPIWWYVAPTIVNSFLEANSFGGKRIVLFATSGGSGFGKTVQFLKNSVDPDTEIIEGKVFSGKIDEAEVEEFARNNM